MISRMKLYQMPGSGHTSPIQGADFLRVNVPSDLTPNALIYLSAHKSANLNLQAETISQLAKS